MMNFLAMQANGDTAFIVSVGGFCIVVTAMIVLAIVFIYVGKIMSKGLRLKKAAAPAPQKAAESSEPVVLKGKLSANTVAAISAAIYQYMDEAHEDENAIITIDRAAKSYSPWSSKIYVTNRGVFKGSRR